MTPMNRKFVTVVFAALLLFVVSGCRKAGETVKPARNVVKIANQIYTTQDLWDFANITLWEMEPKDFSNPAVKEKILQDFVEHRLLVAEAKRRGISIENDGSFKELLAELNTGEGAKELKAVTGHYEIDSAKVAILTEERLMVDELLKTLVISTSYVTEDELKKYYELKKQEINPVKEAHIMHIFTTDPAKAQLAAQELAGGIQFSEVARKYSEGPEKNRGGDLGFIKEEEFPELFADAFKLKEGETSAVIQSDYGYHIFKMVQYAKASRNSYESTKQYLLAELYIEKRQELIREFVNALYSNVDIQYLNDFTLDELFPKTVER